MQRKHLIAFVLAAGLAAWATPAGGEGPGDEVRPPATTQPATTQPATTPSAPGSSHRGDRAPGDDRGRFEPPPLSEKDEAELLEALREHLPIQYERLARLKEEDPRAYRIGLRMTWRWYQVWRNLPEDIKQAAIAEQQEQIRIAMLLQAIRATDDPARLAQLTDELTAAVGRQFDAEQKRLEHRLEELKSQIQRLERELDDRRVRREQFIEQRVDRHLAAPAPDEAAPRRRPPQP